MIASDRGLSLPPSLLYHPSSLNWEQKMVDEFQKIRGVILGKLSLEDGARPQSRQHCISARDV